MLTGRLNPRPLDISISVTMKVDEWTKDEQVDEVSICKEVLTPCPFEIYNGVGSEVTGVPADRYLRIWTSQTVA